MEKIEKVTESWQEMLELFDRWIQEIQWPQDRPLMDVVGQNFDGCLRELTVAEVRDGFIKNSCYSTARVVVKGDEFFINVFEGGCLHLFANFFNMASMKTTLQDNRVVLHPSHEGKYPLALQKAEIKRRQMEIIKLMN